MIPFNFSVVSTLPFAQVSCGFNPTSVDSDSLAAVIGKLLLSFKGVFKGVIELNPKLVANMMTLSVEDASKVFSKNNWVWSEYRTIRVMFQNSSLGVRVSNDKYFYFLPITEQKRLKNSVFFLQNEFLYAG